MNRLQRLKTQAEKLIRENSNCLAIYTYGTTYDKGGQDVDLGLVFNNLENKADLFTKIRNSLIVPGIEIHAFFYTKKDFLAGRLIYDPDSLLINEYLSHDIQGLDPHLQTVAFSDSSMLAIYLFSTMKLFIPQTNDDTLTPDTGLDHIKLTRQGIIDWTKYYTAIFLNNYLRGQTHKLSAIYIKQLAKFLVRVAMGFILEKRSEGELDKIKKSLVIELKKSLSTGVSTDEVMADFIKQSTRRLAPSDIKLIISSGKIRSHKDLNIKNYLNQAEKLLFYLAYQQGIEQRQDAFGPFDLLSTLAIDIFARELVADKKAEWVLFDDQNPYLMRQGEIAECVFYLPLKRLTSQHKLETNGGCIVETAKKDIERGAGRIIGETGVLLEVPRNANVRIQKGKTVAAIKIPADLFRNLFKDADLSNALNNQEVLTSEKARLLDILLRYFSYECAFYLRDLTGYLALPEKLKIETHASLVKNNPLHNFYLGDKFLETIETLYQKKYKLENQLLVKKQKPGQIFAKNQATSAIFFVVGKDSEVILKGISPKKEDQLMLETGAVFGEVSLIGKSTRSSAAMLKKGGYVFAVDADLFKRFANSRQYTQGLKILPVQLLYHLAALNFGRIKNRFNPL
jgi:CRP-like cAMP-binding protein